MSSPNATGSVMPGTEMNQSLQLSSFYCLRLRGVHVLREIEASRTRLRALGLRTTRIVGLMTVLLVTVLFAAPLMAQQEPAEPEKDPRWRELYKAEANGYRFETVGPKEEQLVMHPKPAMQWVSTNDFYGDVFVWTRNGRPELVGTIFSRPLSKDDQRSVMHEFYSFSALPIQAVGEKGKLFSLAECPQAKHIPGAPPPADSTVSRDLQARALAKQFSAHMDRQGERWELRLLNQPLYRYEKTSKEVLGGALFAFVGYVTDPEILLLIEARHSEGGPAWTYMAARFSNKSLWLRHKEIEVWRGDLTAKDSQYYLSPARTVGLGQSNP